MYVVAVDGARPFYHRPHKPWFRPPGTLRRRFGCLNVPPTPNKKSTPKQGRQKAREREKQANKQTNKQKHQRPQKKEGKKEKRRRWPGGTTIRLVLFVLREGYGLARERERLWKEKSGVDGLVRRVKPGWCEVGGAAEKRGDKKTERAQFILKREKEAVVGPSHKTRAKSAVRRKRWYG